MLRLSHFPFHSTKKPSRCFRMREWKETNIRMSCWAFTMISTVWSVFLPRHQEEKEKKKTLCILLEWEEIFIHAPNL